MDYRYRKENNNNYNSEIFQIDISSISDFSACPKKCFLTNIFGSKDYYIENRGSEYFHYEILEVSDSTNCRFNLVEDRIKRELNTQAKKEAKNNLLLQLKQKYKLRVIDKNYKEDLIRLLGKDRYIIEQ